MSVWSFTGVQPAGHDPAAVFFPIILALLCSLIAASVVLLVQGIRARKAERRFALERSVLQMIRDRGGSVTPLELAALLGVDTREAEEILRRMVDDVQFTMEIDDRAGVIRYGLVPEY